MARSEARILASVWRDPDFTGLPVGAQWLYFGLLSQPELSMCGVLPVALSRWGAMAGDLKPKMLEQWLGVLSDQHYIVLDSFTSEAWVRTYMKHDRVFQSANFLVAAARDFDAVHSEAIRLGILQEVWKEFPQGLVEGLTERFPESLPKGVGRSLPKGVVERLPKGFLALACTRASPSHQVTDSPDHLFAVENGNGKPPPDPLKRTARQLTQLAFDQPVVPELANGSKGAFPAAMGIIERVLRQGHPVAAVEKAIREGVTVWTLAGLQTAIAKTQPARRNGAEGSRVPEAADIARTQIAGLRDAGYHDEADELESSLKP